MFYFVTYMETDGKEACLRFCSDKHLFEWMQSKFNERDVPPLHLCIYKGDCLLDWS